MTDAIAVGGFVVLFILMLVRVPVGMAMGLVGVTGYSLIAGAGPALKLVGQTSMRTVTDYTFGVITQQDIGKLFMAGVLPGLLAMTMYVLTILLIVAVRPAWLPAGAPRPVVERIAALKDVWPSLVLFAFVIGGLYGGLFTPTE